MFRGGTGSHAEGESGIGFVDEPHRLLPGLDAGEMGGLPRPDQLDLDRDPEPGAKVPGDLPREGGGRFDAGPHFRHHGERDPPLASHEPADVLPGKGRPVREMRPDSRGDRR